MILQALTGYYEALTKLGKVPAPGYANAKISFAIRLSWEGELKGNEVEYNWQQPWEKGEIVTGTSECRFSSCRVGRK